MLARVTEKNKKVCGDSIHMFTKAVTYQLNQACCLLFPKEEKCIAIVRTYWYNESDKRKYYWKGALFYGSEVS